MIKPDQCGGFFLCCAACESVGLRSRVVFLLPVLGFPFAGPEKKEVGRGSRMRLSCGMTEEGDKQVRRRREGLMDGLEGDLYCSFFVVVAKA
jgi:hypothetical protein